MFSECYSFEPPNPVPKFYYRCDKVFHLDDLLKLYVVHDTYAVVLISGRRTDLYSYSKNNTKLIKSIECYLPNQHKTGGSSAARFGRIRDEKIGLYIKNISELMFSKLVKDNVFQHLGLFLAGPADLKTQIQGDNMFQQHFHKHLLHVMTISEITDQSIISVSETISDIVYGKKANTQLLDRFETMIMDRSKIDLLVFGNNYVLEQLELGELEEIFINETSINLIEPYNLAKIKINLITDDVFIKKYGEMVGLRYYAFIEIDEQI